MKGRPKSRNEDRFVFVFNYSVADFWKAFGGNRPQAAEFANKLPAFDFCPVPDRHSRAGLQKFHSRTRSFASLWLLWVLRVFGSELNHAT